MRSVGRAVCTLLMWWVVAGAATSHTTKFTVTVATVGGLVLFELVAHAVEVLDDLLGDNQ